MTTVCATSQPGYICYMRITFTQGIDITPSISHTQLNKGLKEHTYTLLIYMHNIKNVSVSHWYHKIFL